MNFVQKFIRLIIGTHKDNFNEIDYCDEVEIIVEDEDDLLRAEEIFTKFESFSGARLNRSHKSKIMRIGTTVWK